MDITDIRVRKINLDNRLKAIVSVTFSDMLVIHDVKVVEGEKGLFVAMPSKKMPDGEYKDIAHPISSEARAILQNAVLSAYESAKAALEHQAAPTV